MPTSLYEEIQRRGPADMATCNKCAGMWKLSIRGPSTHVLAPHRGVGIRHWLGHRGVGHRVLGAFGVW